MKINKNNLYVIADLPGYTPAIGRLVSMLNYSRYTLLQSIRGLPTEQLDHVPNGFSNSIEALLLHITSVEVIYFMDVSRGVDRRKTNFGNGALQWNW